MGLPSLMHSVKILRFWGGIAQPTALSCSKRGDTYGRGWVMLGLCPTPSAKILQGSLVLRGGANAISSPRGTIRMKSNL